LLSLILGELSAFVHGFNLLLNLINKNNIIKN
jgi:hypothetical protein